jgi:hypothetical protein
MLRAVLRPAFAGGILLLGLAGCSLGGDDEPRPATGSTRDIAVVVQRLEAAVRRRDYAEICNDLFTAAARRRAGGSDCRQLLRSAGEGVRNPRIVPLGIDLRGDHASVRVRTRAAGQAAVEDVLELRRERSGWRVDALGPG